LLSQGITTQNWRQGRCVNRPHHRHLFLASRVGRRFVGSELLQNLQACEACPLGGECKGQLHRPVPRQGAQPSFIFGLAEGLVRRTNARIGQGTRSAGFRRQAMEPAVPSCQLSSAAPIWHALEARRRSNVSEATSIQGAPTPTAALCQCRLTYGYGQCVSLTVTKKLDEAPHARLLILMPPPL
jgi:hypothetical protein